jgi:hypothetical protein
MAMVELVGEGNSLDNEGTLTKKDLKYARAIELGGEIYLNVYRNIKTRLVKHWVR